jgi:hypothetical protein
MTWVWCVLRVIERFSGRSGQRSRISGRFSTLFYFFIVVLLLFFFFLVIYLKGAVTAPRDVEGNSIMGVVVYIIISLSIDDDIQWFRLLFRSQSRLQFVGTLQ